MNESVIIVSHFCHNCHQEVDTLSAGSLCPNCQSEFIEEITGGQDSHHKQLESLDSRVDTPTMDQSIVMCSICLDPLVGQSDGNERGLRCGHRFHNPCIDKWLTDNRTCPVCRQAVDTGANTRPVPNQAVMDFDGVMARILEEVRLRRDLFGAFMTSGTGTGGHHPFRHNRPIPRRNHSTPERRHHPY